MNTSFEPKSQAPTQHNSKRENQNTKAYPSRTIVHAKLEMTEPGDHDEREADAVANTIVSGGKIARKISSGGSGSSGIAVSQQMESQLSQLQGGGRPMPQGLLSMMENGFGQDFGQVRIHTDTEAADMSSSIGARAFTLGNDIYFNRGQFSPETTEGQRLVAHELTHVVQGIGKVGRKESEKRPYVNRQRAFEAELEYAFTKKTYYLAIDKLLEVNFKVKDATSRKAVLAAFKFAFAPKRVVSNDKKAQFITHLRINNPRIFHAIDGFSIADSFEKLHFFGSNYKQAIRIEYTKMFSDQIFINAYINSVKDPTNLFDIISVDTTSTSFNNYKKDAARSLLKEKERALSQIKSNNTGLKYVDYLIAKRHLDQLENPAEYHVTPDFLITGKTWSTVFFAINFALFSPIISALSGGVVIATILSVVKSAISKAVDEAIKYQYGSEEERADMTAGKEAFIIFKAALLDGLTAGLGTKLGAISEKAKDVVKKALIKITNLEIDALKDLLNYIGDAAVNKEKPAKKDVIAGYIKTLVLSLVPFFDDNEFAKETTDAGITFVGTIKSLD